LEARGAVLSAEVAVRWLAGEVLAASPQVGAPTWAPLVAEAAWEIDWQQSAVEVDRLVRAASPEPGAFSGLGDELLVVVRAAAVEAGGFEGLAAGTPFVRDGQFFLRCGEGALRLDRVRLGRRALSGRALAALLV
jgi:methionyl-tRNA formyltransferase